MEETGLKVDSFISNFRKKIEYHYRRSGGLSHKQVVFFLAKADRDEVKISFEHSGFEWLTFEQSTRRLTFENARNVLRDANDFLSKQAESGKSATALRDLFGSPPCGPLPGENIFILLPKKVLAAEIFSGFVVPIITPSAFQLLAL